MLRTRSKINKLSYYLRKIGCIVSQFCYECDNYLQLAYSDGLLYSKLTETTNLYLVKRTNNFNASHAKITPLEHTKRFIEIFSENMYRLGS